MAASISSARLIWFFALVALVFGFSFSWWWEQRAPLNLSVVTLLPESRALTPFSFVDDRGIKQEAKSLEGQWTLVFFGFTHCPMVCPTTLALLSQTMKQIENKEVDTPHVMMITLDPTRDTAQRLHEYLPTFYPDFSGAILSEPSLLQLTKETGLVYQQIKNKSNQVIDINHSGAVIIINPQGKLAGFVTPPLQPQQLAADLTKLIARKS